MIKKKVNKIVLAYSGGLDTTVAIPYLKQHTGAEIVALGVNVGQPDDFGKALDRAMAAGACKVRFVDVRQEFADDYILPSLKANAMYEGVYPLTSALSRPLICKKVVEEAEIQWADAVAPGCTVKGNDQIRFDMGFAALAPSMQVLAPARHWGFTRQDSLDYAKKHGINGDWQDKPPYSIDENLWGRAIECGVLEDAWVEPPSDAFEMTVDAENAPDKSYEMTIDFEAGKPVAVDGTPMGLLDLVSDIHEIAGAYGVGRIDHIESRVVGIKSREVYECPGAVVLIEAHKALEAMVLTRDEVSFKAAIDQKWAELTYDGKWFSPLMSELNAFINASQVKVTGTVRLKLYKGTLKVVGRKSPNSIYNEKLATYGAGDPFDHAASEGFSKIYRMETTALAEMKQDCEGIKGVQADEKTCLAEQIS